MGLKTFLIVDATGATGRPTAELLLKFAIWHNPFLAQHIAEVTKDHTAGIFSGTDQIIEKVTGQKPMGIEEFIEKNRTIFDPQG